MHNLDDLKQDVREIKADVKLISQILERNTASLVIHEHRTTLAEKRIERFENGVKWVLGLIASGIIAVASKLLMQ